MLCSTCVVVASGSWAFPKVVYLLTFIIMFDANPMLHTLRRPLTRQEETLTLTHVVRNFTFLMACMLASAGYTYYHMHILLHHTSLLQGMVLGGVGLGLYTHFQPAQAWWTAPLYSLLQGSLLTLVSLYYEAVFPGLPMQALVATFASAVMVLACYMTGVVRPTARLQSIMMTATMTLLLLMVTYMVATTFQVMPGVVDLFDGYSPLGIAFSMALVVLTCMYLIFDLALIEELVAQRAPEALGWYAAFSLMVTLILLYLRILHLLGKLKARRRR